MSNIILDTLNTLLPVLLIKYIPIDDISTKSLISYPLSKLIIAILTHLVLLIQNTIYFIPFSLFQKKYIEIGKDNQYYKSLNKYIIKNFSNKIKSYSSVPNSRDFIIFEFCDNSFHDTFMNKKIIITLDKENKFIISSKAQVEIIEAYVKHIDDTISLIDGNFDLIIYKPLVNIQANKSNDDKNMNTFQNWDKANTKTNKRLHNTILSNAVNENFIKNIKRFLDNPEYYNLKGLPYKIGFLLHGEPGTGKTSMVKCIAVEYNLPIFTFNLDIINTPELIDQADTYIYKNIESGKPHILLIEDIDTTYLGYNNRRHNISSLLQLLDGINENTGRIVIITANNIDFLRSYPAFTRPGRIDNIIYVTYCDEEQIHNILKLHYGQIIDSLNKLENIKITSALLIQIILCIKELDLVIEYMNKIKDFSKITNDNILKSICEFLNKDVNINIIESEKETQKKENVENNEKNSCMCSNNKLKTFKMVINDENFIMDGISIIYYNIVLFIKIFEYNIYHDKKNLDVLKNNNYSENINDIDIIIKETGLNSDTNFHHDICSPKQKLVKFDGMETLKTHMGKIFEDNINIENILITHLHDKLQYNIVNLKHLKKLIYLLDSTYEVKKNIYIDTIINRLPIEKYISYLGCRDIKIRNMYNIILNSPAPNIIPYNELLELGDDYILYKNYIREIFYYEKFDIIYNKFIKSGETLQNNETLQSNNT